ncbi:MAG: glycosyltransferase family 2 protein [Gammaproteobacteria bacterium]|nr:glycosyltransferase family 2 protein [Gammaproteobacteria bacterium]MDH3467316.1 glycosyltransferase family 2 protein [Gammaproteobacteria bacterium]
MLSVNSDPAIVQSAAPKISVVIPVYNYGSFLPAALDSVLQQDDSALEIVVVDDGSSDDTAEVAMRWAARHPSRVRYYWQSNRGPGAARNNGAQRCFGDYLLFLDADDRMLPDALSHFRRAIAANPDADLICGGYRSVYRDGSSRTRPAPNVSPTKFQNFRRFVRGELCVCNGGAIMLRKRVIDALRYPETIRTSEDYVFFSQAIALFECVSFSDPVVAIFKHDASLRNNANALAAAGMQMVDLLFDSKVLPRDYFSLRPEVYSRWCLLVSRALLKHGDLVGAKKSYERAIKAYPLNLRLVGYLRKYIRATAKLWLKKIHRHRGRI